MAIAALFAMFSGFYYWIGKMCGRQYPKVLARIHFWMFFIGVNVLFFYIVWRTLRSGEKAAANQWGEGATTLEWTVESPAPFHTHEDLPDMTEKQAAE